MKDIFEPHLQLTGKVMDLRLDRQNLVMGNLANISTPRYKPRRMEFEKELQSALGLDERGKMTRTSGEHLPAAFEAGTFKGQALEEFKPRYTYGQDPVDLDKEMAILQKNTLLYNTLATVMQTGFSGLNKVISEGGK